MSPKKTAIEKIEDASSWISEKGVCEGYIVAAESMAFAISRDDALYYEKSISPYECSSNKS